jgi:hypothetical protein
MHDVKSFKIMHEIDIEILKQNWQEISWSKKKKKKKIKMHGTRVEF